MADGGVCLRDGRRINLPQANGDEMPMIDLEFERLKRRFERGIRCQWDRLLILDCLYENYQCTTALGIIQQEHDVLIKFMHAEFESLASVLQKTEDRYQLRIELDTELYHLTTAQTLATHFILERATASISSETGNSSRCQQRFVSIEST
ncbi:hypothetical protein DPMN_029050 [Dreissena polymorpha]|uniref:Uncharacterized protein n=1 Tax=Dreissena polymorpha TaxID=45954 RepID=A0A9D4LVS3_DREPO|nr:hypothetical protein DPMN_029050 [Dreissena polymorpha]